jgi:hypothetical protein
VSANGVIEFAEGDRRRSPNTTNEKIAGSSAGLLKAKLPTLLFAFSFCWTKWMGFDCLPVLFLTADQN